jgi:hypothetical protein
MKSRRMSKINVFVILAKMYFNADRLMAASIKIMQVTNILLCFYIQSRMYPKLNITLVMPRQSKTCTSASRKIIATVGSLMNSVKEFHY